MPGAIAHAQAAASIGWPRSAQRLHIVFRIRLGNGGPWFLWKTVMDSSNLPLLIVDDDAWTRFALKRLLGQRGWKISTAATVAEGVESLGSAPACVILDLNLPDGNGVRVLRQIREERLSTRVIVSTATGDESLLETVRQLEPDAIIHKPVDVKHLLEACCASAADRAGPSLGLG